MYSTGLEEKLGQQEGVKKERPRSGLTTPPLPSSKCSLSRGVEGHVADGPFPVTPSDVATPTAESVQHGGALITPISRNQGQEKEQVRLNLCPSVHGESFM